MTGKMRFVPIPRNTKVEPKEFVSAEGRIEVEKRIDYSELGSIETMVGLFVRENGASNIANVERDLEHLNGCLVRVKIEILEVPKGCEWKSTKGLCWLVEKPAHICGFLNDDIANCGIRLLREKKREGEKRGC